MRFGRDHPSEAADMKADLSAYRGIFEDGYTDDDLSRTLPLLSQDLGIWIVGVWDFLDEYGGGGNSDLAVLLDGQAHELPDGLWDLLVHGLGSGRIAPVAGGPHPDIDLTRCTDYHSPADSQYHYEIRNA